MVSVSSSRLQFLWPVQNPSRKPHQYYCTSSTAPHLPVGAQPFHLTMKLARFAIAGAVPLVFAAGDPSPHDQAVAACASLNTTAKLGIMHGFGEIDGYSRNSGCGGLCGRATFRWDNGGWLVPSGLRTITTNRISRPNTPSQNIPLVILRLARACHAWARVCGCARAGPQGFGDGTKPGTSTQWPCTLNMASTFDPTLALEWGTAMGEEFWGKGTNIQEVGREGG
jgi:hypothetical protein